MKEVSSTALVPIFDAAKREKVPIESLYEGLGYSASVLKKGRERIEWSTYCRIIERCRAYWDLEDFEEMGRRFVNAPLFRAVAVVAPLLFGPVETCRWMFTTQEGVLHRMFTCIVPSVVEPEPNKIQLKLTLASGYESCPEFFSITKGCIGAIPRILGLPDARVELSLLERGAHFDMTLPEYRGVASRLRRWLLRPFFGIRAAKELKKAYEDLHHRYLELEKAQARLDAQATQLRMTNSISQAIRRSVQLEETLASIVRSLVEVGGCKAAALSVWDSTGGQGQEESARFGSEPPGVEPIQRDLHSRESGRSRLVVWPPSSDRAANTRALLEHVGPVAELAIEDALVLSRLQDYRTNLEQKVRERTRELETASDELAKTVDELRAAQSVRQRFFANINHEIRTPLSLITLAADEVRHSIGIEPREQINVRLDSITANVHRLLELVDGLLVLAAGQEKKLRIRKSTHDLSLVLREIVSAWQPGARASGVRLNLKAPPHFLAEVDRAAFERIVGNLVSNAFKFTPAKGQIDVALEAKDSDAVALSVSDTGVGIEPELREKIFERFEQGPEPVRPSAQGSGVGLSIVRELALAHGGTVSVDGAWEKGTRFVVTLERGEPAAAVLETSDHPMRVQSVLQEGSVRFKGSTSTTVVTMAPAGGQAEATILVAEDEPELRATIGRLLSDRYRVALAANGRSALECAQQIHPDLLITDVRMPVMDGLTLASKFAHLSGNRLAPIIMLTAFGSTDDKLRGFEAGAIDYLVKPFSPAELRARVESQLALRGLALRLHESEKLASLGTLSAGLAHELRNPANAVVNAVHPLRALLPPELTSEGAPAAKLIQAVEAAGTQIAELSRELLGLVRPGEFGPVEVSVTDLVERALQVAAPALQKVTVDTRIEVSGIIVCGVALVTQTLVNLLENAAQATGEAGSVSLRVHGSGDQLFFDVCDSGPGVPIEYRERIFEPFFTTKDPGVGTGLGLTLSRMHAIKHGGNLVLLDADDGASFRLSLPREQPAGLPRAFEGKRGGIQDGRFKSQ